MLAWYCGSKRWHINAALDYVQWFLQFVFSDPECRRDQERIRWLQDSSAEWKFVFVEHETYGVILDDDIAVHFLLRFPDTGQWIVDDKACMAAIVDALQHMLPGELA